MEDNQPKKGGLSSYFNIKSVAKHIFSPTMIVMMAFMAFPAVAAIPPDAVTFTDIGAATVDHFKTMFTAPFTDGGVVVDAAKNAIEGDWSLNYEFGEAHAGHSAGASMPDHNVGNAVSHSAADAAGHDALAHVPAVNVTLDSALSDLSVTLSAEEHAWLSSFNATGLDAAQKATLAFQSGIHGLSLEETVKAYCIDQGISLDGLDFSPNI